MQFLDQGKLREIFWKEFKRTSLSYFIALQTKNGSEPQYIRGQPYGVGRIKEWRRGNPYSWRTFKQQIGVTSTCKCGLRILWIPCFHHKDVYHIRRLPNCVLNLTNMEALVESNFISSFFGASWASWESGLVDHLLSSCNWIKPRNKLSGFSYLTEERTLLEPTRRATKNWLRSAVSGWCILDEERSHRRRSRSVFSCSRT